MMTYSLRNIVVGRIELALAILCVFYTGCTGPALERPLGERWQNDRLVPFEGQWVDRESGEVVLVKSSRNHELFVGKLDFDHTKKQFDAITIEIAVTTLGNRNILFGRVTSEERGDNVWHFYQLTHVSPDELRIRSPSSDVFEFCVKTGEISGNVSEGKKGRVLLTCNDEQLNKLFLAHGEEKCFPADGETTLRRVGTKEANQPQDP